MLDKDLCFNINTILTIPEHAFNSTDVLQNNSVCLWLRYNEIKSIDSYAFYYLNNLGDLWLNYNQINFISKHAFDFSEKSENELIHFLLTTSFAYYMIPHRIHIFMNQI